ncbi:MAG: hypothetical protein RLZZ180_2336 [Pseudomonadota bacterium]|jgi:catechol 2,3-dioxygenase-like lactoylglutathione lyase family enzyme
MQNPGQPTQAIDLDHVGFIVQDLSAARDLFVDLGFVLTERADHTRSDAQGLTVSAGSSQHSIMLEVGYIELMQITDVRAGHQLTPATGERYGLHVLALGCADARAWHARCLQNALSVRPVMDWSRPVHTPERSGLARFAFFDAPWQPSDPSYVCWVQHVTPELVRSPSLMRHPNGARALRTLHYEGGIDELARWAAVLQDSGAQATGAAQHGAMTLRLGPSAIDLQPSAQRQQVLPSALTLAFSSLEEIERRADRLQLPRLHHSTERLSLDLRASCGLVLHAVREDGAAGP